MAATKQFTMTKATGIRKNSRRTTRPFEALATFYVGSFETVQQAARARAIFVGKVRALRNANSKRKEGHVTE